MPAMQILLILLCFIRSANTFGFNLFKINEDQNKIPDNESPVTSSIIDLLPDSPLKIDLSYIVESSPSPSASTLLIEIMEASESPESPPILHFEIAVATTESYSTESITSTTESTTTTTTEPKTRNIVKINRTPRTTEETQIATTTSTKSATERIIKESHRRRTKIIDEIQRKASDATQTRTTEPYGVESINTYRIVLWDGTESDEEVIVTTPETITSTKTTTTTKPTRKIESSSKKSQKILFWEGTESSEEIKTTKTAESRKETTAISFKKPDYFAPKDPRIKSFNRPVSEDSWKTSKPFEELPPHIHKEDPTNSVKGESILFWEGTEAPDETTISTKAESDNNEATIIFLKDSEPEPKEEDVSEDKSTALGKGLGAMGHFLYSQKYHLPMISSDMLKMESSSSSPRLLFKSSTTEKAKSVDNTTRVVFSNRPAQPEYLSREDSNAHGEGLGAFGRPSYFPKYPKTPNLIPFPKPILKELSAVPSTTTAAIKIEIITYRPKLFRTKPPLFRTEPPFKSKEPSIRKLLTIKPTNKTVKKPSSSKPKLLFRTEPKSTESTSTTRKFKRPISKPRFMIYNEPLPTEYLSREDSGGFGEGLGTFGRPLYRPKYPPKGLTVFTSTNTPKNLFRTESRVSTNPPREQINDFGILMPVSQSEVLPRPQLSPANQNASWETVNDFFRPPPHISPYLSRLQPSQFPQTSDINDLNSAHPNASWETVNDLFKPPPHISPYSSRLQPSQFPQTSDINDLNSAHPNFPNDNSLNFGFRPLTHPLTLSHPEPGFNQSCFEDQEPSSPSPEYPVCKYCLKPKRINSKEQLKATIPKPITNSNKKQVIHSNIKQKQDKKKQQSTKTPTTLGVGAPDEEALTPSPYRQLPIRYEDASYYYDEDTSYYGDVDNTKTLKKIYENPSYAIQTKYMRLPLDHFKKTVKKKWYMRFLQNTVFWQPNSTIYLLLVGNRPVSETLLTDGLIYELANETGGVMFAAEHRYYGIEEPIKDLKYLTSRQALADFYIFLRKLKREPDYVNSKVVIIGGGYGGSLAVWMKVLYPETVDAVLASSAPLLAQVEFPQYYLSLKNLFQNYMPVDCQNLIFNLHYNLSECLVSDYNAFCLYEMAYVCPDVDMSIRGNRRLFLESELSFFEKGVQLGLKEMFRICKQLKDNDNMRGDLIYWNETKGCFDYNFGKFVSSKDNINIVHTKNWMYQQCNEFGFFRTTTWLPEPYSETLPLKSMYAFCEMIFGPEINERKLSDTVSLNNELYGGLNPNVQNVIFTHGDLDPWKALGVTSLNASDTSNKVIIIPMVTHCRDLLPRSFTETKALRKARRDIKTTLKKMIGFY